MREGRLVKTDVHLYPEELVRALREDVLEGLTATPKELPPKWFYDERGSQLFDEITRLPEYYPTRREREILVARADEIASVTGAQTLVELGSGTSEKTRILLAALRRHETLNRFVPFDVSEEVLREAAAAIDELHPGLEVHAVVGDFDRHLDRLPAGGRRLIAFLGGTIGNFPPVQRERFLAQIRSSMRSGDHALIGFDLVKDVDRLEAAYNDAAGVTADFNRNVLRVINRELDADFDVDAFEHVAFFDRDHEWIEMRLRSTAGQPVRIGELDLDLVFKVGEVIRTEISAKFRPERAARELEDAGLPLVRWWTDSDGDFGLALTGVR
jgi:L-histidine N-alpha-methyltransferase